MIAAHVKPQTLRVFLVEDNADLREELLFGLNALGVEASGYADAVALYRGLAVQSCDIVVIDVGLPGEDGFSIAEHLRANDRLGIVFLTARNSLQDRLRGLSRGADAFLVKPIDVHELAATLKAIARRLKPAPAESALQGAPHDAAWSIVGGGWVLRDPAGCEIGITELERRFLEIMLASNGRVVERERIIAAYMQDDADYDPHRLDSIISRLRKRTGQAGLQQLPIKAVRGAGYVFAV